MASQDTLLSQIVKVFDQARFTPAIEQCQTDKWPKFHSTWQLFINLIVYQLTSAQSLRTLSAVFLGCAPEMAALQAHPLPRSSLLNGLANCFHSLLILKNFINNMTRLIYPKM